MIRRVESRSGAVVLRSSLLEASGVAHAFSTRLGGVSQGTFASLNFGNPTPCERRDPPANIRANFQRLLEAAGADPALEIVEVHQVHGPEVHEVRPGEPTHAGPHTTKADAIVCADPSRAIAVRTADCAPILIASRDGRWVAAVHAGWRGTVGGIIPATIKRLRQRTGEELVAAVGPCIGPDAFEVGEDVAVEFRRVCSDSEVVRPHPRTAGKWLIDLAAALAGQLAAADVHEVDLAQVCTYSGAELFFSHRREQGLTGRMAALITPASPSRRFSAASTRRE